MLWPILIIYSASITLDLPEELPPKSANFGLTYRVRPDRSLTLELEQIIHQSALLAFLGLISTSILRRILPFSIRKQLKSFPTILMRKVTLTFPWDRSALAEAFMGNEQSLAS